MHCLQELAEPQNCVAITPQAWPLKPLYITQCKFRVTNRPDAIRSFKRPNSFKPHHLVDQHMGQKMSKIQWSGREEEKSGKSIGHRFGKSWSPEGPGAGSVGTQNGVLYNRSEPQVLGN